MRKKIGIITFHWAANYGAVLQAYALQQFLLKNGYDTEIIDYRPGRVLAIQKWGSLRNNDRALREKRRRIQEFRTKELILSKKHCYFCRGLKKVFKDYSVLITGSDQVWNESFTLGAEGKPTLSYFLQGAPDQVKRLSYAASFGTEHVTAPYKAVTEKELRKFQAISVRENTGKEIIESYGLKAAVVCDPTQLLGKEDYDKLLKPRQYEAQAVFPYILHGPQPGAEAAALYVQKLFGQAERLDAVDVGLYEWLYRIRHAEMLVTNSFHGVMLALIFNTPFLAVTIDGSGMNDRLHTLLRRVGLEDRLLAGYDEGEIGRLCKETIDWEPVNQEMREFRLESQNFLLEHIGNIYEG